MLIRINENLIVEKENDEIVVVDPITAEMYMLKGVSVKIWDIILNQKEITDIELENKIVTDGVSVRKDDLLNFINELVEKQLLFRVV